MPKNRLSHESCAKETVKVDVRNSAINFVKMDFMIYLHKIVVENRKLFKAVNAKPVPHLEYIFFVLLFYCISC